MSEKTRIWNGVSEPQSVTEGSIGASVGEIATNNLRFVIRGSSAARSVDDKEPCTGGRVRPVRGK